MTKLEKLAQKIYDECAKDGEPVSMDEATEMAKMEMGEKEVKRYEKSEQTKPKTKRERKIDETKKHLMDCHRVLLEGLGAEVEPLKTEAEMNFTYQGESYTVKLIKHRKEK